jgi:hypothetical protein
MNFIKLLAATYCLLTAAYCAAQTKVQVVSKTVERDVAADVARLTIQANKADVVVRGWAKPTMALKVRYVAKHPDRATAEREVEYLGYDLRQKGNTAELTNRYTIPQTAGKVQSTLAVTMEVWLPQRAGLSVGAMFGDLTLADLGGEVQVRYEYGRLTMTNLTGKTNATSVYGDLEANNTAGQLTLKTEKANVLLRGLSGAATLQCRYGHLTVRPDADLSALTVTASRTEVLLLPRRYDDFQYDLRSTYAEINVPASLREHLSLFANRQVFDYAPSPRKPLIKIENSYTPLGLQTLSSAENVSGK